MQVKILPSKIAGEIFAPASKSSMQRACAAALVHKGKSVLHNFGKSNDDKAAVNVIQTLGCELTIDNSKLTIDSSNAFIHSPITSHTSPLTINCGESGLGIRMFAPLVALHENEITMNGEGSLLSRPMDFFDETFPLLGVQIISNNGKLPLKIKGPLQPKNIEIDGSLSSQFLTGLLLAYAASLNPSKGGTLKTPSFTIKVNDLKSKPYIDLTLKVMKDFDLGVPLNKDYSEFVFEKSEIRNQKSEINYIVEGDWSGGAFLLVAGAVAGHIIVRGLDINSTQADKKILEALKNCGCEISIDDDKIIIHKNDLVAFNFDATDCPDLFPPLAALAVNCTGKTVIKGVHRLAHKESNRGLTIQKELKTMNVEVELKDNEMIIHGSKNIKSANVHSHHDHRIAMMCAVLALNAEGETTIEEAEAINKSYPDFYEDFKKLNASLNIE